MGKPPRMIIADGDVGQMKAFATMYVLEDVVFHEFLRRSIKHTSKEDAINRVVHSLNMKAEYSVVEADGTAWDTCCSTEIREITENIIVNHLWKILKSLGFTDEGFEADHRATNSQPTLKVKHRLGVVAHMIKAIKRSGHRGTSILNWIINHVLTLASVSDGKVEKLMAPDGKHFKDINGKARSGVFAHEGDDTIYTIAPPLSDEDVSGIQSFWKRCGFAMKLFRRSRLAEFTGYKIPIVDGKLKAEHAVPDFLRAFRNGGLTTSREALDGDVCKVAASKFAAYSWQFRRFPSIARMFERWARTYGWSDGDLSREDVMRLGFGPEAQPTIVLGAIEVSDKEEEDLLKNTGVLDNMSYRDLVTPLDCQEIDTPFEWAAKLAYTE